MQGYQWIAGALAAACVTGSAVAQNYPRRPVTLVVPFSPGGATDVFARTTGRRMGELLGQQVVILNRDGAAGAIGTEFVAKSAPDGYTLLWGTSSPLAIFPAYKQKLPYDVARDLLPVSLAAKIAFILAIHPALPARSLKELIALARAHPGKLNYASAGTGGAAHLAGELFKSMAKIDIVHIPYKGTALFATDLVSGQVELAFAGVSTTLPLTTTNRLRAIAFTGLQRSEFYPQVPTMAEAGLPGYEYTQWYAIMAPAQTPPEIIETLNAALRKALEDPEVKKRIAADGGTPTPSTPGALGTYIKAETAKYAKMISEAGIKLD
ncbi:MAG: Bug family tripartite tricarboxylate transporter substrate binding protein [Burkholderiales bacterium]